RAYNALGYDAAAIGNHEFDFGPVGPATSPRAPGDDPRGALEARAAEAHFPFLAANLIVESTGAAPAWPNVVGTKLFTVADIKVVRTGSAARIVRSVIHQPRPIPKPGAATTDRYEDAPVVPDRAVEAAIAPALAAARQQRQQKLGVTIARPIAPAYAAESAL